MELYTLCIYALIFIFFWILYKNVFCSSNSSSYANPFLSDAREPIREKITDQKTRDAILKQGFKSDKVSKGLDAIVIGSGIGGLSTAALLAKSGKCVLVLEQHDQAGGCCHSFIDKGYEFDVGIHYIGEMLHNCLSKTYLDQISEGQILWEEMSNDFDHVVFKEPNKKIREYSFVKNSESQKAYLKKCFPKEAEGIEKFYELSKKVSKGYKKSLIIKFLPLWLVKIMYWTNTLKFISNFWEWNEKSVKEVVQSLISDQELEDILCYCFGDYGSNPSNAGFPMQCFLLEHFSNGAAYPVGGASEIAHSIIPVIEKSGGKVLVRARVTEILTSSGRAVGVKVQHGSSLTDVYAPLIISDAGIFNTFEKMLPKSLSSSSRLWPFIKRTPHAVAAVSVFVGIDCPAEKLDISHKTNFWIFTKNNIDKAFLDYLKLSKEEYEDYDVPLMFASFASTKDPSWDERYPGKTTLVVITLCNYEWFSDWKKKPSGRRGDDYEVTKNILGQKIVDHICDMFPKIKDHIDYVNVGSPLSNDFYLGSPRGEIYGLDHDSNRFSPLNHALLRPTTDIPGLFLTGQDVCSGGLIGALYGGLLCTQQIMNRNLMKDLNALHTSLFGKLKNE